LDEEQSLFLAGEYVTNFDDDVDDSPENDLALNVDHIFEADEYDAFDSDVDEGPTTHTMFMANLTSEDPIYDEAGPSYDLNTPFEVQDSDADYTSDSNIIPYDQYVEDNEEQGVQSRLANKPDMVCGRQCNVSSVRNDALMSILDEMHEQGVQSRLANKPDMVMNDSVTSELTRYKELVEEYEKRAKFELTDRERKIDEQMRIIISDRNRKKAETLALKPISALTVYPPNTPVKLVPRILPTKSQVKINHNFSRNLTKLAKLESPLQVS
ncbi:hypothetical protein Tco_0101074, partial [Tanacetum coccineum]